MTERLFITRAQLKAVAAVAREMECTIEVERGGTVYRVAPDDPERKPVDTMRDAEC